MRKDDLLAGEGVARRPTHIDAEFGAADTSPRVPLGEKKDVERLRQPGAESLRAHVAAVVEVDAENTVELCLRRLGQRHAKAEAREETSRNRATESEHRRDPSGGGLCRRAEYGPPGVVRFEGRK